MVIFGQDNSGKPAIFDLPLRFCTPQQSHPGKWYGYLGDLFGRVPSRFLPGESRAYLLRDILENVELWENAYPEKL